VVVDEPCDQQVLMEIMALTGFGSVGVIWQDTKPAGYCSALYQPLFYLCRIFADI
jgi:hypothetical protein